MVTPLCVLAIYAETCMRVAQTDLANLRPNSDVTTRRPGTSPDLTAAACRGPLFPLA